MVTEATFFEHVSIRTPFRDIADRSIGTITSRGNADDVPAYFRREKPIIHYGNGYNGLDAIADESSGLKMSEDLKTDKNPPYIGKIEKLLDHLGNLVTEYMPIAKRKALIYRADFLQFQKRIDLFLQNTPLKPEIISYYKERYLRLVEMANKKSQVVSKSKAKKQEESKDDNWKTF